MTLTIDIPVTADALRVIDGICNATGWNAASGLTKPQWAKARIIDQIKGLARSGEIRTISVTIQSQINAIDVN